MEKDKEIIDDEFTPEVLMNTPRMQIRRFKQQEWMRLLHYLQDDGIADAFPEGAYTERRLRDLAADPNLYALMDDDELIGHVFYRPGVQPLTAELGLGISSDYRRRGYGNEAVQALLRHGFDEWSLHRITVTCPPESLALRALFEKIGMRMEGFFRQSLPTVDGEWKDQCLYALLRSEWIVHEQVMKLNQPQEIPLQKQVETEQSIEHAGTEPTYSVEDTVESLLHVIGDFQVDQHPTEDSEEHELEDLDITQVTVELGDAGTPFAPILTQPNTPELEPVSLIGTVVGVERPEGYGAFPSEVQQRVDGISFWLRRPHDFNWLAPFGIVFKIWDQQDSGNIAFGLKIEDQQVFIKYAGASTVRYEGYPFDAVRRLRDAARSFEALQHPNLVRLLDHFDTEEGYALIFEWTDGELLLRNDDPDSGISKFRRLPIQERLDAMQQILDFHVHVEASGYVAIDLYDGSLIYDFERKTMTICDIDFYCPAPYTNEMGRMWGSSRFMSPEEYELGAEIDSRTNVYALGAMAFCLLGNESDRSRECWEASDELYEIAAKAVSAERTERWESVEQFCEVWEAARFKD